MVREWRGFLLKRAKLLHVRVPDDDLSYLAALCALAGGPEDEAGLQTYHALTALCFQKNRLPRLRTAVQAIPPTHAGVLRVVRCIQAWSVITGGGIGREKFRLDWVIEVMVQIPDPQAYVRHVAGQDFSALGAIFHPNTLERAKRDLRGIFGGTEGEDGYWARTRDTLNIIDD